MPLRRQELLIDVQRVVTENTGMNEQCFDLRVAFPPRGVVDAGSDGCFKTLQQSHAQAVPKRHALGIWLFREARCRGIHHRLDLFHAAHRAIRVDQPGRGVEHVAADDQLPHEETDSQLPDYRQCHLVCRSGGHVTALGHDPRFARRSRLITRPQEIGTKRLGSWCVAVAGEHIDQMQDVLAVPLCHSHRDGMRPIELFDEFAVMGHKRVDLRLPAGQRRQMRGRGLIHHVPHHDAAVTHMGRHNRLGIGLRLGPPLPIHPVGTRVGHPHVPAFETRSHAKTRVKQDRHDLQSVRVGRGQKILEVPEKGLGFMVVDQRLEKDPHTVQLKLRGITEFPLQRVVIIMQPHLDVGSGIRGHVIRPPNPPEVIGAPHIVPGRVRL